MDISTIVVIVVLTALSLGAIAWMEIHSRKSGAKGRRRDGKSAELNETETSSLMSVRSAIA